jgi:hypothetical protein
MKRIHHNPEQIIHKGSILPITEDKPQMNKA